MDKEKNTQISINGIEYGQSVVKFSYNSLEGPLLIEVVAKGFVRSSKTVDFRSVKHNEVIKITMKKKRSTGGKKRIPIY